VNFLKKLFSSRPQQNPAQFFYVRPKRCNEIVGVRIDLYNEPSLTDEGQYFVRKVVRAIRCPFPAELHVYLDNNRRIVKVEVEDGEQVSESDYQQWMAEKSSQPS